MVVAVSVREMAVATWETQEAAVMVTEGSSEGGVADDEGGGEGAKGTAAARVAVLGGVCSSGCAR